MSATETREYRVFLHTWDVYDVVIEATSKEEALAKAEALYESSGCDAFDYRDNGSDGFTCEEGL